MAGLRPEWAPLDVFNAHLHCNLESFALKIKNSGAYA